MRSNVKIIYCAAAAAFLLMAIVPRAPAQSVDDDNEQRECERETATAGDVALLLEALGLRTQSDLTRLPLGQISEDLGYLRTVIDYLSNASSQNGELNFEAIAKASSEIRKRAGRLKESLALPKTERETEYGEEEVPADAGQLRAALSALSAQISDALGNPVLRGHLLDITGSVKAGSELDQIVFLSERIKACSETLGKTGRRE